MHRLPDDCRCSNLTVSPATWNTKKATTEKDWIISYRFYCPDFPKGKLIQFRAANKEKDIKKRQKLTEVLIRQTLDRLYDGFNPVKKEVVVKKDTTVLSGALQFAICKIKVTDQTRHDIGKTLKKFLESADNLNLDIEVNLITRKHIRAILDDIQANSKKFTDNTFNHHRKYLSILFTELVEFEMIGANPVKDIKKRKVERKIQPVLTSEQRQAIDEHLKQYTSFRRFLHIFFHSGSRIRELMRLKCKDVNLKKQEFTITIQKGRGARQVKKPIKDIVLPFWAEIDLSNPDKFVFARNLEPSLKPIRDDQINKRWRRLVQIPLDIWCSFYSLKHLHSDELAKELGLQAAKSINSHESEHITKFYAQGEGEREKERIRKVGNKFA